MRESGSVKRVRSFRIPGVRTFRSRTKTMFSSMLAAALMSTAPILNVGEITISPVSQHVTTDAVEFTGTHPRFTGIGDAAAGKRLNARMAEWEKEALARAKAAAVTMRTDDRSEQWKAEGVFSYEVKRNGGGIASLLFSDYLLHAGGANGLDTKTGLTFFTVSGETLTLPELFSNSENGMCRVNSEVNRLLEERGLLSQLLVSNPSVEAGQPFYLTDTCLVIVVRELTWFPHSMGTVELEIPLAQLQDCLRAELQP